MKILLDHNLDRRLAREFSDDEVFTTQQMGWADLLNGELLSAAESNGFKVMLSADSNLKDQQNMSGRQIAIIVLRASNNRRATHIEMIAELKRALPNILPGQIIEVFHTKFAK